MTGLLTRFLIWINTYFNTGSKWNAFSRQPSDLWTPCSYDCYDEGGCSNCSEWVEWEDPDYGTVGEWRRDDNPDEGDLHDEMTDRERDFLIYQSYGGYDRYTERSA